ncbi:MAG: hypothetical protein JNM27_01515 [Leptospirales bacterium]|nr:hypothetical protein [Leptospirales bacterium]
MPKGIAIVAQRVVRFCREHPAIALCTSTTLAQFFFLRSLPWPYALMMLIPATGITYLVLRLTLPWLIRRFNRPGRRYVELLIALVCFTFIYTTLTLPWWSLILMLLLWLWMIFQVTEKAAGHFWTALAGLLIFVLFLLAHRLLLLEQGLLYAFMQRSKPEPQLRMQGGLAEATVERDGKPVLGLEIPKSRTFITPRVIQESEMFSGGIPLGAIGGRDPWDHPTIIFSELMQPERGNGLGVFLGGMNFAGTVEMASAAQVDRLAFAGFELDGIAFEFRLPKNRKRMRMGFYCSPKFDTAIVLYEEVEPGFPHSPTILKTLDSLRPGIQKGNPNCTLRPAKP